MRLLVTGGVCVGLVLTGCTGQDNGAVDTAEEPSPSETPASPEDEALDAYDSMWEVVVEASHEGDPDPPELENYAAGDALALMQHTLEGAAGEESSAQGEPELDPEVVGVSPEPEPDTVTLLDCADGSQWVLHNDTEEADSGNRQIDATVVNDGLSWRVSELRIWEPGTC